uniref:Predicted nuclease of the RNAse H fold, HicB family n=1 Tax=Candidatus Kentrum eta TaxID=2126337 RepID=A0A450UD09_9GAMM|nr:MAG: Predicted nuclease of the RNAse H fold, HicB family [Candidatus Kentron sp. H]VFJ90277.1 MAG: Predicted nuclease of the RNAse H fold, HicB family [Candidatus Kentron sp. H]VFJ94819.1 MAG: Predicted nuclease of the RNAse H fold, HicB family [Candidatus Kentron sp. H]VFJ99044.1 MAG: Predicted nuclease of the RNAse H fold, HicB family [Candidatus Kentron sp. H]VFK05368.1 MAG: Predicted nuclease of the RNAse H fold, HicB family [Candidatus Kentron sp. H]
MKLKVIIHEAEEGGYWAEVPAIPGCATQGEDLEELIGNLYDAVEGCLAIDMDTIELGNADHVMELAVRGEDHQRQTDGRAAPTEGMDPCPGNGQPSYLHARGKRSPDHRAGTWQSRSESRAPAGDHEAGGSYRG